MRTYTLRAQIFALAVVSVAAITIVAVADQISWSDWPQLLLYFSLLVLAYSIHISGFGGIAFTPSAVLTYLAIYIFNPPTALILSGTSRALGDVISRGWVPWRALFNGAQIALSVGLGALAYRFLGGMPHRVGEGSYLPFLVGPLVTQVANHFFVANLVSQWRATPVLNTWFNGVRYLFWQNLLSIPTAVVLAVLSVRWHFTAVLVYLLLLQPQWRALGLYVKRGELYAQVVDGLVVATDLNFPLGRGHAASVAKRAVAIAREMRLSESEVESVQFAALLHDVGMIGKDDILERPFLTAEDGVELREHVRVGAEIAKDLPRKEIALLILHHHERFDGDGYPARLKGLAIPLGARIIALAETVDSMVSGAYPYAAPLAFESILSYVASESGHAFDPAVVEAFFKTAKRRETAPFEAEVSDANRPEPTTLGSVPAR